MCFNSCPLVPLQSEVFSGMSSVSESNSSLAWVHHIRHRRGDTFVRTFEFFDDEACTIPTNIVGRDFKAAIVDKNGRTVLDFAIGAGLTIVAPNKLKMAADDSKMKIPAGVYSYDIEQKTTSDNFHFTIIEGQFKLDQDFKQWSL